LLDFFRPYDHAIAKKFTGGLLFLEFHDKLTRMTMVMMVMRRRKKKMMITRKIRMVMLMTMRKIMMMLIGWMPM
jgi:hypothetical protein